MDKNGKNKKFNLRSFISFSLIISTLVMSWSGFILYVAPPGRIANWGTWKLMLFNKAEWQALHTIFSYLFFILAFVHLFFINWRTLITYIRSKLKPGLNRKWELGTALLVCGIIFVGTLRSWSPFGPIMVFGDRVREGWGEKIEVPPVVHMEDYTLDQLSAVFDSIPATELMRLLSENKIKPSGTDVTLETMARENHTTPAAIYSILYSEFAADASASHGGSQGGYGKMTVKAAAAAAGRDPESSIIMLRTKGIEATGETTLKTIAGQLGITPREVYDFLTK